MKDAKKFTLQIEMIRFLKANSLFVCIVTFFCIFMALKIFEEYRNLSQVESKIHYEDSKILRRFIEAYRSTYQQALINNDLPLNEANMHLLPVVSLSEMSREFTTEAGDQITVNAVTDRPRNLKNLADNVEDEAMRYFKANPSANEYFKKVTSGKEHFYFYASPLFIEEICLKCHGSREDVLPSVADKYSTAYGYQAGDLRGIVSIKMKKADIKNDLIDLFFIKTTLVTLLGSILFLTIIFFLIRKMKIRDAQYTDELEQTVLSQTVRLREQVNLLQEYSKVLDASVIVSRGDLNGKITYVNEKMCDFFGYNANELVGRPYSFLQHPDMDETVFKNLRETMRKKNIWHGLVRNQKKNGVHCWTQSTICPIINDKGAVVEYITTRADVTELVENRQELQTLLTMDTLTGLPNRYQILQDLSKEGIATVILIDIHAFADINDYFGIETGDRILVEFARGLLRECAGKPFQLYKLPGDQFALLLKKSLRQDEVITIVEQLTENVGRTPYLVNDSEIAVHVTCGISWNSKNGLLEADIALKQAKENRREYVINKESVNLKLELEKKHTLAVNIKNALSEGRVVTFYQPIVVAGTGVIDKYECLVRIIEEDGSITTPYYFLDAAKRTRIYTEITRAVIDSACAAFAGTCLEFSINLSTLDILDPSVVEHLKTKLNESSLSEKVILEIVETEGFENYDQVAQFIKEMKGMGCKIAIDDFGSGHSNYERLLKLRVDYLKIDGSIIKKLTTDEISQTIVETIVAVAKKLEIQTVAEFVFDKETAELATSLGVDFLQGYYFSEPMKRIKISN